MPILGERMSGRQKLFNSRVVQNFLRAARMDGIQPQPRARSIIEHWTHQLASGAIDRLTESEVEQTFNNEIFGKLLGYRQIGEVTDATLMPKKTGISGNTPDFVLGRFEPSSRIDKWAAVGEVKDSRTDLDQPQASRKNKETPVEQGFRYATMGRPGIEWVIVSNFREVRLYKNGYIGAYHWWKIPNLLEDDNLYEFYMLLRPEGLIRITDEPLTQRILTTSISAGHALTEEFYALYKLVQQELISKLRLEPASRNLTITELYGKTHKLLNRILFAAFSEDHPGELLPRDTLKRIAISSKRKGVEKTYWEEYKQFFDRLNVGGGVEGFTINAFNGGLFAPDKYFDRINLPDQMFVKQFHVGTGRRRSQTITGIFGFDVYDFAEDLNVQALGAIFEQSLKDIPKGKSLVRGFGEVDVTSQKASGVFYTPREITSYIVKRALQVAIGDQEAALRASIDKEDVTERRVGPHGRRTAAEKKKDIIYFDKLAEKLKSFKVVDPACGSGAFLVEMLEQLHGMYERTNKALAALTGSVDQRSFMELDRLILRNNLHGMDILSESVEISRLSIWLRTAKKGEKLESLESIIVADSLKGTTLGVYDVVMGNPPWGADLDGWIEEELVNRFPNCGEEKDSYAIFVIRAWEMLRPGGVLGFILPNSWLTVNGYSSFRGWLLKNFDIVEITNVWKIFKDVNHDACILIAKKRDRVLDFKLRRDDVRDRMLQVRAISRGVSEAEKLKQIAEENWFINHETSHNFQYRQTGHRLETIYSPEIADELDRLAERCLPLCDMADITVGIQVYHHTRVKRDFIKQKGSQYV
jgi:type I restriction-modification system DNA methylase subunit